ncbi:MAG: chitobiase/beta-hexosaminidase C-terminal domain-containing protein, partial [Lachnospiraceae bacterium]|nr:chitobiase/beta-hexosaminidase C-terminal domain-containing protein [Lachnospiraceae bacterium]
KKQRNSGLKTGAKIQLALILSAGAVFLGVFMTAIIRFNRYFDFDRQYAEALSLHDAGDFEASIGVARHALSIDSSEDKVRLLIADDYYDLEKYDESNAILFAMLDDGRGEDFTVYERIIENYMAVKDYPAIVSLLDNSEDPELKDRYSMYYAGAPVFSVPAGEYEEDFQLSLSSDAAGVIYYTTDGSEPDNTSKVYRSPLSITEGEITISAVFINEFGIRSDVVSGTYMVDYPVAKPPTLIVESGTYEMPRLIRVEYPENYIVYYTTNGEDPDSESRIYERALDMPLGSSEFKFIAYDDRGRSSEIVTGSYKLNMVCYIDRETALNAIKIQLMSKGENSLLNEYKCYYGYGDGKNSYYLIDEYTYAGSRTGRRFAVDTKAGSLYEASFSRSKQDYVLTPI